MIKYEDILFFRDQHIVDELYQKLKTDNDNEELEKFVDAKISPKIINIISEKIDDLREKGSYLDYYQEKGDKILEDSTKKTNDEIREQIGYVENASFDKGDAHEIRRI